MDANCYGLAKGHRLNGHGDGACLGHFGSGHAAAEIHLAEQPAAEKRPIGGRTSADIATVRMVRSPVGSVPRTGGG